MYDETVGLGVHALGLRHCKIRSEERQARIADQSKSESKGCGKLQSIPGTGVIPLRCSALFVLCLCSQLDLEASIAPMHR